MLFRFVRFDDSHIVICSQPSWLGRRVVHTSHVLVPTVNVSSNVMVKSWNIVFCGRIVLIHGRRRVASRTVQKFGKKLVNVLVQNIQLRNLVDWSVNV